MVLNNLRAALTAINPPVSPSVSSTSNDSDGSAKLNSSSTKSQVLSVLRVELSLPLQLTYRATNIEEIEEIALIDSVIEDIVGSEIMQEMKLSLLPELDDDGKTLWLHVCCAAE